MQKIDPRGWTLQLTSGATIIASAIMIAVTVHHRWSWPFFLWGAAIGPIASAYAYFSAVEFGRRLVRRMPAEREAMDSRSARLWSTYRATYAGAVLMGVAVGIFAAGLDSAAPDAAFTVLWLLFGVLVPWIAVRILSRRLAARGSIR